VYLSYSGILLSMTISPKRLYSTIILQYSNDSYCHHQSVFVRYVTGDEKINNATIKENIKICKNNSFKCTIICEEQ